jgi:hypothetical protein
MPLPLRKPHRLNHPRYKRYGAVQLRQRRDQIYRQDTDDAGYRGVFDKGVGFDVHLQSAARKPALSKSGNDATADNSNEQTNDISGDSKLNVFAAR